MPKETTKSPKSVNKPQKQTGYFSALRTQYNTSHQLYETAKSNPEISTTTETIILNTIYQIANRCFPKKRKSSENKITGLDAYYIPPTFENLTDDDLLNILSGILCRPQFFGKDPDTKEWTITNEGLVRLNNILDSAARHTMRQIEEASIVHSEKYINHITESKKEIGIRLPEEKGDTEGIDLTRYGIGYFKNNFKNWTQVKESTKDKKRKIYFNIRSLKDYLNFIRGLISSKRLIKDEYGNPILIKEKGFSLLQHDGMFLKNIIAFSDMEKDDAYKEKRTIFRQIIREIFYPFLQIIKEKTEQYTTELENHESEFSIHFKLKAYGKTLEGKFILCTKAQASMIDKIRRDSNYYTSSNLKDTIRGSIVMKNQQDLLLMMHYFAKYFIQNPEGNFDHSIFNYETNEREGEESGFMPKQGTLRNLTIEDKGILSSNSNLADLLPRGKKPKEGKSPYEFTNDELDWAATQYLINTHKNTKRKTTTSKQYIDTKYTVPITIRGNSFPIELKFMDQYNEKTNNKGLNHHSIMRLKQLITLRSRDQKSVTAYKIRYEIELLLKDEKLRQEIQEQMNHMNEIRTDFEQQTPEDFLYSEIIKDLVILEYEELPNLGNVPIKFCDRTIRQNLGKNNYNISLNKIDANQHEGNQTENTYTPPNIGNRTPIIPSTENKALDPESIQHIKDLLDNSAKL